MTNIDFFSTTGVLNCTENYCIDTTIVGFYSCKKIGLFSNFIGRVSSNNSCTAKEVSFPAPGISQCALGYCIFINSTNNSYACYALSNDT